MAHTFAAPVPILRSFDEAKAKEFYVDFLGFEVTFEHRFEENTPLYMGLQRGDCRLHLSEHFGDGTPGTSIRILVSELVAFQEGLLAKKYRHARPGPPVEQTWGTRELMIKDPFGNTLVFFEDMD